MLSCVMFEQVDVSFDAIWRLGFEAILPVFPALSPDGQPAIVRRGNKISEQKVPTPRNTESTWAKRKSEIAGEGVV